MLYAQAALQTLIKQKVCARIAVTAKANIVAGRLELRIKLFRTDGTQSDAVDFDLLWKLSSDVPHPLDP